MPELVPFRGLRYDALAVPDLGDLLCPPFDVISPSERASLAARDARNAVHLELPEADDHARSPYEAAARRLATWRADGTLRRDDRPLVYVYEQEYVLPAGNTERARGFFCRLRLELFGVASGVRPHEATMSGPKEDRFRLLSAVRANISPVLLLFDDDAGGLRSAGLLDDLTGVPSEIEAIGPGGARQRLWLVDPATSPAASALLAIAGARPLTIADGHHRYETALRYQRAPDAPEDAAYVLALLYDAHSGGLSLLPWHRLLRGIDPGALVDAASRWFSVEQVESSDRLLAALAASSEAGVIGLWTPEMGAILRVDRQQVGRLLPAGASESLRWLDVSVVSSTLREMIGTDPGQLSADGRLTYTSDARDAVRAVDEGRASAALLLRPTPIDAVLAVAAAGEHMPAKSTFFHPKAATGLVFNELY